MQRFIGTVGDLSGVPSKDVSVAVYNAGTSTLATIFSDKSGTSKSNPFLSGANGHISFHAANGRYDLVFTKNGMTWTTEDSTDVLLYDPLDALTGAVAGYGLYLRSHPDTDVDGSKILLVKADLLVLQDGSGTLFPVAGWSNMVLDMNTSGANGLDTGSAADAWYEVWALRKSSDGTKALILHRARDFFLDEDGSAGEDGAHILRSGATTNVQLGQGFKVDTTGVLPFVEVKLIRTGAPTGRFWFEIRTDNAGVPSSTVVATSQKFNVSELDTVAQWVCVPFRSRPSLTATTQYHLVLVGDYTPSGTVCISWRADTTAAAYANGSKSAFDGTTWTADTDDDFTFKAYIERTYNSGLPTLPGGYDQYALLGHSLWDTSIPGWKYKWAQRDRTVTVRHGGEGTASKVKIGNFTVTTQGVLTDVSGLVPPIICLPRGGGGISGGGYWWVGGHEFLRQPTPASGLVADKATVMHMPATSSDGQIVYGSQQSRWQEIEFQRLMVQVNAATGRLYLEGWEW